MSKNDDAVHISMTRALSRVVRYFCINGVRVCVFCVILMRVVRILKRERARRGNVLRA